MSWSTRPSWSRSFPRLSTTMLLVLRMSGLCKRTGKWENMYGCIRSKPHCAAPLASVSEAQEYMLEYEHCYWNVEPCIVFMIHILWSTEYMLEYNLVQNEMLNHVLVQNEIEKKWKTLYSWIPVFLPFSILCWSKTGVHVGVADSCQY